MCRRKARLAHEPTHAGGHTVAAGTLQHGAKLAPSAAEVERCRACRSEPTPIGSRVRPLSRFFSQLAAVALGLSAAAACSFDLHDVVHDHDSSSGAGGQGGTATTGGGTGGGTGATGGGTGGSSGTGGSAQGGTGGAPADAADAADAYQPGSWCASQQPVALCAEFPNTQEHPNGGVSLAEHGREGTAPLILRFG